MTTNIAAASTSLYLYAETGRSMLFVFATFTLLAATTIALAYCPAVGAVCKIYAAHRWPAVGAGTEPKEVGGS